MRPPMIARNEIFEDGQHVGLTYSGYMLDAFDGVGEIIDTKKYSDGNTLEYILIEVETQFIGATCWDFDRIIEFTLYKDEVKNGQVT